MSLFRLRDLVWVSDRANCWTTKTVAGIVSLERVYGRWVVVSAHKHWNKINRTNGGNLGTLENAKALVVLELRRWCLQHFEEVRL